MAFVADTHRTARPAPSRRLSVFDLLALRRQRRALGALSPDRLADLGITPEAAQAEARRPFWDIPARSGQPFTK